jgi:hypothetical protein
MKKLIASLFVLSVGLASAQTNAFKGKDDLKFQIGANMQDGGTGIMTSLDYGLGESFSLGVQAGYLLGVKEIAGTKPDFGDRFDAKVRFNANLGKVMNLPSNIDIYPGLNLGLKNFGGHLGARYFFDKGFGLFTEMQFPIAKYNDKDKLFRNLNNQFAVNVGVSFDIAK